MQKSLPSVFRSRPFAVAALATVLLFSLCAGTALAANAVLPYVGLYPAPYEGGDTIVKFYPNDTYSWLSPAAVTTVNVHWGTFDADGNASWTVSPGDAMTYVADDGAWECTLSIPDDAVSLEFLFNDGGSGWAHYNDSQGGNQGNWICDVLPVYTITWNDDDDTTIDTTLVVEGDVPSHADPEKPADAQGIYTFAGWSPALAAATADATYTATYTSVASVAKIGDTFYASLADAVAAVPAGGSGVISILSDTTLSAKLEVAGKTIEFAADQAVTVTGQLRVLDGASVTIGENVTFTSEAHPTVFVLGDPAVNTPGTSPSTLVIDGAVYNTNPGFDATFAVSGNGTDSQGVAITVNGIVSNANGIAIYQPEPGSLVINGTVVGASAVSIKDGTLSVNDGAVVAATLADGLPYVGNNNGDSPTGDAIIAPYYDPSRGYGTPVVEISGGTITVADTANCSGIEAYDFDGVEAPADAASNVAVSGGTFNTPVAAEYCADGFIPEDNGDGTYGVEAGWTITFVDEDGTELAVVPTAAGETPVYPNANPTKAATAQYTYTFAGWSPALAAATADATYTATYSSTLNKYRLVITYVTPAGTVTPEGYAAEYEYGEEYNVASPDVDGCTPDIAAVTGAMGGADVAVTVTYTLNRYTVTFKDGDGSVISSADYDYGTAAADIVKPADPTKEADAQYTYSFAGWSPTLAEVTEDATYTATYSSTLNQYTVTFVWHGDSLVCDYDYGTSAEDVAVPRNPPSYVEDNKICTFSGWDPATVAAVSGDATYTATYTETAAVAKIGDTFYATLADAVAAVPAGGSAEISILSDTTLSAKLEVAGKTIAFAADQAVTVTGQLRVVDGASVTIGENVTFTSEGHPTVFVLGDPAVNTPGTSPSALVIDGAVYNTNPGFDQTFAVSGNGSDTQGVAVTVNGIVSNANGIAIYQPEPGSLVINGTVVGASAVSIKDGTLSVNDGAVVEATLADGLPYTGNNSGETPTGDAIIAPYYDPARGYGTPVVEISGGTIAVADTANCSGIEAYDFDGVEAPADAASNVAVSGGTFNTPVADAYCADGFIPLDNGDGTYGVEPGWTVTFVNEKGDAPPAQKIADGATAGEPEEPTAEGFAFAGWFAEGESEAFDFDTAITADLTLTAAWDTKVAVPEAVAGLVYNGAEQTGVVADAGYTLAGNTAINAGGYTATATLEAGFIWSDNTFAPKEIPWSIAPAPVTITAVSTNKVYGHMEPAFSYTAEGFVDGDTLTSGWIFRQPGETVDRYAIVAYDLSAGDNYSLTFIPGEFEITARPITVQADDCSKIVGAEDPAFTASITSGTLVEGQSIAWSFERAPGEETGTYAIRPIAVISAGLENVTANYDITVVPGSLAIESAYVGAKSKDGLVVLSAEDARCEEPLSFLSIAVDGATVTAEFSGTIVNPNGVDTTELGAFYLTTLTGTPVTNCVTATISDIDAANGTATMTVELPAGFDSATFFLAGFGDAE